MRPFTLSVERSLIGHIALSAVAAMLVLSAGGIRTQSPAAAVRQNVHLPDETTGIDAIARILVATFDHVDIVALGEVHDGKLDSDLRLAVIRHPDFAKKVRAIVIECGSTWSRRRSTNTFEAGTSPPLAWRKCGKARG